MGQRGGDLHYRLSGPFPAAARAYGDAFLGARIFLKKVLRRLLVNLAIGFDSLSASDKVAVMQNKIISK
jgi:hypothetical protein